MGFLARLMLGSGTFPTEVRARIDAEGPLALEEGLKGSVTAFDYRAPGTRSHRQRVATVGAVAVTPAHLFVLAPARQQDPSLIEVAWADAIGVLQQVMAQPDGVKLTFGAADLGEGRSGRIEVFLRAADPAGLVALVDERRAP